MGIRRSKHAFAAILAAATLLVGAVAPAAAAPGGGGKNPYLLLDLCVQARTALQFSFEWNDIRADQYSIGYGQRDGQGLGVFSDPFRATSSGSAVDSLGLVTNSQQVVVAGVTLYLRGQVVAINEQSKPSGGWPSC